MTDNAALVAEAARAGGITGFIPTRVSDARDYPPPTFGDRCKNYNDVSGQKIFKLSFLCRLIVYYVY